MYLAFDTETTDVPRPHLDLDHRSQPQLLQFAGVLFDEQGNELDRIFTLVKPNSDALLSHHAFEAHGISLEQAFHQGAEPLDVYRWFTERAADARQIVGHNVYFDLQVMKIVGARLAGETWEPPCPAYCTMAQATPVLNLPPTPRMKAVCRYTPKPPTLSECVEHFFGEKHVRAHDARADVRACIRLFRHLTGLGTRKRMIV